LETIQTKFEPILDRHCVTDDYLVEKCLKPALEATKTEHFARCDDDGACQFTASPLLSIHSRESPKNAVELLYPDRQERVHCGCHGKEIA
jgi:hypothetical protein